MTTMTKLISILNSPQRVLSWVGLLFLLTMGGCASTPPCQECPSYQECPSCPSCPTVDNCEPTCQMEYQSALKECDLLVGHESDPAVKDRQMGQCLQNKGFDSGFQTCRTRCQTK